MRLLPRGLRTPAPIPDAPRVRFPGVAARRLAAARGGATAIEFGLLALPFLLMVTTIMDCSRVVWTHLALQAAAEQAARCAVVDTIDCGTAAQIQAYAAAAMLAPGATAASFSYTAAACGSQVSASVNFPILVPGYLPASILLTAQSCAPS